MSTNLKTPLRIAIIGGGPSGLSAAETLRELDPNLEITVFEQNAYFGGKCCTVLADGRIANGQPGGYEVGAGVFAEGTWSYHDTEVIISRYQLQTQRATLPGRTPFKYFQNGQDAWHVAHPVSLHNLFFHPVRFLRGAYGYLKYGLDMLRFPGYQLELKNHPKILAQHVSERYPAELLPVFSTFVQGFGYADLADPGLSPPVLYYHHYLHPDLLGRDKINFDLSVEPRLKALTNGTQGIWAAVSQSFPAKALRLNATVTRVDRHPDHVRVHTPAGSEAFDYCVVATSFQQALKYMDFSEAERTLLDKVKYNHYVTVLCKADNVHAVATTNLSSTIEKAGIGHLMFIYKRYPDSPIVTAYLYVKPGTQPSDADIIDQVEQDLKTFFNSTMLEKDFARVYHWEDYFGHLDSQSIREGWFSAFDTLIQGKGRTLFVSSGLRMETIAGAVQYARHKVSTFFA